jgi:hypothetical protein
VCKVGAKNKGLFGEIFGKLPGDYIKNNSYKNKKQ